jgi:putative ABC transport system permease protein
MAKLIYRNLLRNKKRTLLNLGSITLMFFLLCCILAFQTALQKGESASKDEVIVRSAISLFFLLPESYWQRLKTVEHVVEVTPRVYFGGEYKDTRPENDFTQYSADPETAWKLLPEYQISEAEKAAWVADRAGFVAGKRLVDRMGWKIGDQIFLKGKLYPVDLQLTLRGIFTNPAAPTTEEKILFQRRYLEEALGNPGEVGAFWVKVDSPRNIPAVIDSIEAMFKNSEAQVKAETERSFQLSFISMLGNVRLLVIAISLGMLISILFINGNTMAMSIQERIKEIAVLKSIGFGFRRILSSLLMESMAVFVLGAALALLGSALLLRLMELYVATVISLFDQLTLTLPIVLGILALAGTLGILSSLLPAVVAARLDVAKALRRLA